MDEQVRCALAKVSISGKSKEAVEKFIMASELERSGRISEAIKLYEQAYRMDPDVNLIAASTSIPNINPKTKSPTLAEVSVAHKKEEDTTVEIKEYSLMGLPWEIVPQILYHVGKRHIPSLEECSLTCHRLYLSTRDNHQIWKRLISDLKLPSLLLEGTSLDREMFIRMPRVRTDGVYICKQTYFRPGLTEGAFFQPIHMVTYYRYLRFLPSSSHQQVVSAISAEEPKKVINYFKDPIDPRWVGHVKFEGQGMNFKYIFNEKKKTGGEGPPKYPNLHYMVGRYFRDHTDPFNFHLCLHDPHSTNIPIQFQMELTVVKSKKRPNSLLRCDQYFSLSQADGNNHSYIPTTDWSNFVFARVRSYVT